MKSWQYLLLPLGVLMFLIGLIWGGDYRVSGPFIVIEIIGMLIIAMFAITAIFSWLGGSRRI